MIRRAAVPVAAVILGLLLALGYMHVARTPGQRPDAISTSLPSSETARRTNETGEQPDAAQLDVQPTEPPQPAQPTPHSPTTDSGETIQRLIAGTRSPDPQTRATAIEGLADVPKTAAIPVLEHVLETGEPGTDRQIALQSLHTIALKQGDEDQRIRNVLRGAIYHGDDEEASQSAQALLEDIESELAQRLSGNK